MSFSTFQAKIRTCRMSQISRWETGKPTQETITEYNPKEVYCVECEADFEVIQDAKIYSTDIWRPRADETRAFLNAREKWGGHDAVDISKGVKGKARINFKVYRLQSGVLRDITGKWDVECPFPIGDGAYRRAYLRHPEMQRYLDFEKKVLDARKKARE